MRAAIALLVLTAAVASADNARIAGNVLVWHDAKLRFDPSRPDQTVQAATLKDARGASAGVVAAMRVIGVRGDLVEVEPSKDHECTHSTFEAHDLTTVRFFVSRADLAPVIAKKFAKTFGDGTRVELEPGMPVVPTEEAGVYVVPLAFEMLRVELPAEVVGYSYAAAPRKRPDEPGVAPGTTRYRMHMEVTATLGGKPFTTRKDLFTPVVGAVETTGGVTLFPLEDRCGRAKVALPKDEIETFVEPAPAANGAMGGVGMLGGTAGEYLPASTPMFAGKQRVGTLAAERSPLKGTKCLDVYMSFDQPFLAGARSKGQSAKVQLCAPSSTKLVKREGLGIGRIGDVAPLPPLKDAKLDGHVLVAAQADWYTDTAGARAVQLVDGRLLPHKERIDFAFAVKVVGTAGHLVEVEIPRSTDCAAARIASDVGSLRLFVARNDLMPVLARPFSKTFKNGSRITLSPGVAVAPSIDGYVVTINGDHVIVPIPGASIGYSYTPVNVKPVPKDEGLKRRYRIDGDVMLGEHPLTTKQTATRIVKHGEDVLFPLVAPCIDALVVAPKAAVGANEIDPGTASTGVVAARPIEERWFIPKGTALRSAKGRVVAKAAADIDVPRPADGAKEVCHAIELRVEPVTNLRAVPVRPPAERTLPLCVPAEQIKHTRPY